MSNKSSRLRSTKTDRQRILELVVRPEMDREHVAACASMAGSDFPCGHKVPARYLPESHRVCTVGPLWKARRQCAQHRRCGALVITMDAVRATLKLAHRDLPEPCAEMARELRRHGACSAETAREWARASCAGTSPWPIDATAATAEHGASTGDVVLRDDPTLHERLRCELRGSAEVCAATLFEHRPLSLRPVGLGDFGKAPVVDAIFVIHYSQATSRK